MDLLVRVWFNQPRRQAFLRKLSEQSEQLQLESVWEFCADDVLHDWEKLPRSGETISTDDARAIRHSLNGGFVSLNDTQLSEFEFRQLAHVRTSGLGCKVYLFIYWSDKATFALRELMKVANAAGLHEVTVHSGRGFCDLLVKGVVDSYATTAQVVHSIQAQLAINDVSMWTLVPPAYHDELEGEALDAALGSEAGDYHELLDIRLTPSESDLLLQNLLDPTLLIAVRAAIQQSLPAGDAVLEDRRREQTIEILSAVLSGSEAKIIEALQFFLTLERDLRGLVIRLAQYFDLELPAEPDPDETAFMLKDIQWLEELSADSDRLRSTLEDYFGTAAWPGMLRDSREAREMFIHGVILDAVDGPFDIGTVVAFFELVTDAIQSSLVINEIRQRIDNNIGV